MPDIVLTYFIFTTTLCVRYCCHLFLTDDETRVPRNELGQVYISRQSVGYIGADWVSWFWL